MSTPLYSFLKRKPNAEANKRNFESMQEDEDRGSLVQLTAQLLRAHQSQSAQLDRLLIELQEQKRAKEAQSAQTQASWAEKTVEEIKTLLQEDAQAQRDSLKDARDVITSKFEQKIDWVERRMDTLERNVTLVSQQMNTVIQVLQPLQELSQRPRLPQQQSMRYSSAYSGPPPRWPVQYPNSSMAAPSPLTGASRRHPVPQSAYPPPQPQQVAQRAPAQAPASHVQNGPTKLKLRMPAQLPVAHLQDKSGAP